MKVGVENIRGPTTLPVVARWVRFGGKIECIPEVVIQKLRKLEAGNELVREVKYANPYVPGTRVRVHLATGDILAVVVQLRRGFVLCNLPLGRVFVPPHKLEVV